VVESNGVVTSASPSVPLRPAPGPAAPGPAGLAGFVGREVVVTGRWTGGGLLVGPVSVRLRPPRHQGPSGGGDAAASPQAPRRSGEQAPAGGGPARARPHADPPPRPEIERALMAEGVLLAAWSEGAARFAVTTAPEGVRAALSPVYGRSLRVVPSRWSRATLDEILSVLGGSDVVCSFGDGLGPGPRVTVSATLLHLPARLARELARFPVGALDLDVVVRPVPTAPASGEQAAGRG
jgi:hypothetical protein